MRTRRLVAVLILAVTLGLGYLISLSEQPSRQGTWLYRPFKLGLDLRGGSHLVFEADTAGIPRAAIGESMSALKEVLERRVNAYGVSEPLIQVERGFADGGRDRLIVELPGVTDLSGAIKAIKATPLLEFKILEGEGDSAVFVSSGLTGRFLKRASIQPASVGSLGPAIELEFNAEGADLFARITQENLGRPVGIFLDGQLLSAPVVREQIREGRAEITGLTVEEARPLVRNLNLGALPVPIQLLSIDAVGGALGQTALTRGVRAGAVGLLAVGLFMILWYRFLGLLAVVALGVYLVLMLAVFKLLPVTLTAASIAGFILSLGMAVDANILIFERIKEEMAKVEDLSEVVVRGFERAWLSIRDSNLSTIISSVVLFWFATSFVKGFALTLAIGVLVNMFTAITVARTFLLALGLTRLSSRRRFLLNSGF